MKAKVSRGSGFRGALDYVFDKGQKATHDKQAELIGGTMGGEDPRELAQEFAVGRQLRPDIAKPVWHCSLTLPAGERLDTELWGAVVKDFMGHMGFDLDNTLYVAARHCDTDYDHVHIIASRVGLDGNVWLGQWEARSAIDATQKLERNYGLVLTTGLESRAAEKKTLTGKEINMAFRTGKEPPRQRLQRLVDEAINGNPTAVEFVQRLEIAGVGVRANIASTGRMNGFSFEVDGVAFKASSLGKGYTWNRLQEKGVNYEQDRDRKALEPYRLAVRDREKHTDLTGGIKAPSPVYSGRDGKSSVADIGVISQEYRTENGGEHEGVDVQFAGGSVEHTKNAATAISSEKSIVADPANRNSISDSINRANLPGTAVSAEQPAGGRSDNSGTQEKLHAGRVGDDKQDPNAGKIIVQRVKRRGRGR